MLSDIVFGCLFIFVYLQKFLSVQNRTEVYILKSTMQWCGLPGLRKHKRGSGSAKERTIECSCLLSFFSLKKKKEEENEKKAKKKKISWLALANYHTSF